MSDIKLLIERKFFEVNYLIVKNDEILFKIPMLLTIKTGENKTEFYPIDIFNEQFKSNLMIYNLKETEVLKLIENRTAEDCLDYNPCIGGYY